MTIQNDPELGLMTFDGALWVLSHQVLLGDSSLAVEIDPENAESREISSQQRVAARFALALPPDTLQKVTPHVVQNYDVYREMVGDAEMPPLGEASQVWDEVRLQKIYIPPHDDARAACFFVLAECDWDVEHGLYLRFRNGALDDVDQQNEFPLD